MTKAQASIPRQQWESNLKAEAAFWSNWLGEGVAKSNNAIADDFHFRTRPHADMRLKDMFAPYLRPSCPPGSKARILDVGAGPLTWFPREWKTRDYVITPIDPLADEYDKMLGAYNITPQFRTIKGEAETLDAQFPPDSFHLVFCRNALEEFYDPLGGIRQMLKVVQPNCCVMFIQEDYRSDDQKSRGPWTLEESNADLYLNLHNDKIDLAMEFADVATVRAQRSWHWPWVLGAFKKETI